MRGAGDRKTPHIAGMPMKIGVGEGELIGVLTGTGGISDIAKEILAACKKDTRARVLYEPDPQKLIHRLLRLYEKAHFRKPSSFARPNTGVAHKPRPA